MKKYLLMLILIVAISFTNAQGQKISTRKKSSYKLLKTLNINGGHLLVFVKDIKEAVIESAEPQQDPNAPKVVTALKHLMDYDDGASGEEYVFYRVNSKGKKIFELAFPKEIKNEALKITTEGGYLIKGNQLFINFKKFDYHFPSEMTTIYRVDKYGRMFFIKRDEKGLSTDGFSDEYVKRAPEKTIKSN